MENATIEHEQTETGAALDVVDSKPAAVAEVQTQLERLIEKVGPRCVLPENEWQLLLGISQGRFFKAKDDGELQQSARPRWGYVASDVKKWIEERGVEYQITPVAEALLTATARDVIEENVIYDAALFARRFWINEKAVVDACRHGEIRDNGAGCSPQYIPGRSLIKWIDLKGVRITWPVYKLARSVNAQRVAEINRINDQNSEKKLPPTIAVALGAIEREKNAEQMEELESRQKILALYREILLRRNDPRPSDAGDLAKIVKELEFDESRLLFDSNVLDQIVALEGLKGEEELAGRRFIEGHKMVSDEVARHEEALLAAKKFRSEAIRRRVDVGQASRKISELKERHSHLFQ